MGQFDGRPASPELAQSAAAAHFGRELLAWYRANKRQLPWRENRDPYRIWVSEIMLQQTRVDTVIPYFSRFMERFPTIRALAEAPEEEVLKCWEGLGYYSRARNLQAGAQEVVRLYGGIVPDDVAAVSALKGVGPYTAGAIMSIAFNRPEPAVDGNVMRVFSRYYLLEDDVAKPSVRVGIERLARAIIPEGAAGDFNQAIMELGALVCTPKSPGCLLCPVLAHCAGRAAGREAELPVKTKAKPPRPELRLAALIEGAGEMAGRVLVRRRPDSGLLARMWELPHVLGPSGGAAAEAGSKRRGRRGAAAALEAEATATAASDSASAEAGEERMVLLGRTLAEEARLLVRPHRLWMEAEHVFSHIRWDVQVYAADFGFFLEEAETAVGGIAAAQEAKIAVPKRSSLQAEAAAESQAGYPAGAPSVPEGDEAEADAAPLLAHADMSKLPEGYRWIGPEDMAELAFPNVFLRILNAYWDNAERVASDASEDSNASEASADPIFLA
jgi:A/G-specific adenine glycosylase